MEYSSQGIPGNLSGRTNSKENSWEEYRKKSREFRNKSLGLEGCCCVKILGGITEESPEQFPEEIPEETLGATIEWILE